MKNKNIIPVGAPQRAVLRHEFIIVIRSSKGTLHAVNDQRRGPGALASFETMEDAVVAAGLIPDCQRFQSYFLPVE